MSPTFDYWEIAWTQLWQVSLAILLVALISARWGRRFPHLIHLLWMLVIVKALVPPVISTPVSMFSWLDTAASSFQSTELAPQMKPTTVSQPPTATALIPNQSEFVDRRPDSAPIAAVNQAPIQAANTTSIHPLVAVWMIGAMALLAYTIAQWMNLARTIHRSYDPPDWLIELSDNVREQLGIKKPFRVVVNSSGVGPLIYGFFRPTLVLPAEIVQRERQSRLEPVIAHEMIHARRGDTLFGLIQFIAQIVWWFHPLVWWANRQTNRFCEQCCDEEVIAGLGCKPEEYAHALLDVLEYRRRLMAVPALAGVRSGDVTANRLMILVHRTWPFVARTPRWHWAALAVAGCLLIPGAKLAYDFDRTPPVAQQRGEVDELILRADALFAEQKWDHAADAYHRVTEKNQFNGMAWFRKAYALHAAGRLEEAIDAHRRSTEFEPIRRVATYNWACALALLGREEEAMTKLHEAIDMGFRSRFPIQNDPDLEVLLSKDGFRELSDRAYLGHSLPGERQFDFALGKWEVFDDSGALVGINTVTADPEGLVLTENWSDIAGEHGANVHYYDKRTNQWTRKIVSGQGPDVEFSGYLIDGKMTFTAERICENGSTVLDRLVFIPMPNGQIRKQMEQSFDEGKTWVMSVDRTLSRHYELNSRSNG